MTERVRRPEIERIDPQRGMANLVRETSGAASASNGDDVVSRSIGVGYRIVEEYLQQSRSAAAAMSPGVLGDAGSAVTDLTSRMARTTADMFDIWFQVLSSASATRPAPDAAAPHAGTQNGASPGHPAQEPSRTGIEVEIASTRPARVSVDLRPGAGSGALVVHALRSNDDTLPRIEDVSVDGASNGRPVIVRVRIAPDQPGGIYSGMIIDQASSLPVGTVSVILSDGGQPE